MKKAFTLIELLVVIAIIAILAAILFPVFAQAKAAAKSSVDLSNLKQNALGILLYCGDSDDMFPQAFDTNYKNPWPQTVQPYTKSYAIFRSPLDASSKLVDTGNQEPVWGGVAISYGTNGYLDSTTGWPPKTVGPITPMHLNWAEVKTTLSQTQMTNVADTVLLTDRFTSDLQKATNGDGGKYAGNMSAFNGNMFVWINYDVPNGGAIPDGRIVDKTKPFPTGANGGVSVANANKSNFAMTDGHAKSMTPAATNPDLNNQKDKNLWNGLR